jgi:hypothetical protein
LRESYEQLRGLVGFVRDMVLYVIWRDQWCDIIVLNAYLINSLSAIKNFVGRCQCQCQSTLEDIFNPTIGNKSVQDINNDNGVVSFATSINLTVKSNLFPRCNIHKRIWTSHVPFQKLKTDNVVLCAHARTNKVERGGRNYFSKQKGCHYTGSTKKNANTSCTINLGTQISMTGYEYAGTCRVVVSNIFTDITCTNIPAVINIFITCSARSVQVQKTPL